MTGFNYTSNSFSTAFGYAVADFQVTPIPEPGTLVLVGAGLAIVASARRGRRLGARG